MKKNLIDRKNTQKEIAEKLYAESQALHARWKRLQEEKLKARTNPHTDTK